MDPQSLLNEIRRHFDEKTQEMRSDIRDLSEKLDNYQERLVRVESMLGFIKVGAGVLTSVITYVLYKYVDIFASK